MRKPEDVSKEPENPSQDINSLIFSVNLKSYASHPSLVFFFFLKALVKSYEIVPRVRGIVVRRVQSTQKVLEHYSHMCEWQALSVGNPRFYWAHAEEYFGGHMIEGVLRSSYRCRMIRKTICL